MTDLTHDIQDLTGQPVQALRPLSGGDVSNVYTATLADGTELVAKTGGPVGNEADMLRAIAATGCPAATVIAATADILLMTKLSEGRPNAVGWAQAGEAIARMHGATGPHYGWTVDHAIGPAPQPNTPNEDWPTFWAERRLLAWPEALPTDVARRLDRLARRLPEMVPARPPASLLHGDLWTGNLLFDGEFQGLIDPASYYGDGEVDLAALVTFGTPSPPFWEGYGPLRADWQVRRPIYQLWIALLHLRLFGGAYRNMVTGCLDATEA